MLLKFVFLKFTWKLIHNLIITQEFLEISSILLIFMMLSRLDDYILCHLELLLLPSYRLSFNLFLKDLRKNVEDQLDRNTLYSKQPNVCKQYYLKIDNNFISGQRQFEQNLMLKHRPSVFYKTQTVVEWYLESDLFKSHNHIGQD
ncbi:hypothetical protein BpHYR1_030614 [Brachionus plicatilis]|uniref:Uncharacterized protein n=1 Tax=Brachionus plicatilis TaxID=10195 RepID=A0A3M7PTQ6_BRAPC|nr:hypothetical protein BpHYR1_030614 [Brachionus plicatilis]